MLYIEDDKIISILWLIPLTYKTFLSCFCESIAIKQKDRQRSTKGLRSNKVPARGRGPNNNTEQEDGAFDDKREVKSDNNDLPEGESSKQDVGAFDDKREVKNDNNDPPEGESSKQDVGALDDKKEIKNNNNDPPEDES